MEENKTIDWNEYLDHKTLVTLVVVAGSFFMAYISKMNNDLALVLAAAIGSFNWFGKR